MRCFVALHLHRPAAHGSPQACPGSDGQAALLVFQQGHLGFGVCPIRFNLGSCGFLCRHIAVFQSDVGGLGQQTGTLRQVVQDLQTKLGGLQLIKRHLRGHLLNDQCLLSFGLRQLDHGLGFVGSQSAFTAPLPQPVNAQ